MLHWNRMIYLTASEILCCSFQSWTSSFCTPGSFLTACEKLLAHHRSVLSGFPSFLLLNIISKSLEIVLAVEERATVAVIQKAINGNNTDLWLKLYALIVRHGSFRTDCHSIVVVLIDLAAEI
ncbi:expressed unknown protein [Seminavis robusta]|uniref:Uncharacterized protein n=1 Tax=Seminavis robusta TaxID=568900 RepID=A0A9N8E0U1_9STRA|nr:expressed unknown protein [Seminavis robusta]|eukprot:Sro535_g162011.1  (123) ;mRNA; r:51012-51380